MPVSSRGTPIRTPPGGAPTAAGAESFAPPGSTPVNKAVGAQHWHRQVAAHDRKMSAAYQSGRSGMPADPDFGPDELAAHGSGAEEAAQPAASPPASTPRPATLSGSSPAGVGGKVTAQGAPLLLGVIGYCVAVNWVRYGWPGVTGWFTAKFENKLSGQFAQGALPTNAAGQATGAGGVPFNPAAPAGTPGSNGTPANPLQHTGTNSANGGNNLSPGILS